MTLAPKDRLYLLGLLERRKALRDLISVWPNVERPENWMEDEKARAAVLRAWSETAVVMPSVLKKFWRLLFSNGFVTPDGRIDPTVERLIGERALDGVPGRMKRSIEEGLAEKAAQAAAKAAQGGTGGGP